MLPSNTYRVRLRLAALLPLMAALSPIAGHATTTNMGTAYRLDNGAAAYREIHLVYSAGGTPARLVLYRCMEGPAFARKIVVERAGALTPDFDFVDARTGHREGVRTTARGREVYWQKSSGSAEKTRQLDIPGRAVIDAGFDAKVRSEWSRLAAYASVSANFLLPSALRFFKVGIERVKGKSSRGVTHLRMKLDTWYGFAAPDTDLDYRDSDQRLLRFKGIGSIRDMQGRNQAVRIEFPNGLSTSQASATEIEAARRAPLTGRCGA